MGGHDYSILFGSAITTKLISFYNMMLHHFGHSLMQVKSVVKFTAPLEEQRRVRP